MVKFNLLFVLLFFVTIYQIVADSKKRVFNTSKINSSAPEIDGKLYETAWDLVEWSSDFTQRTPTDGAAPSQKTQFKILYDDNNLYIGIRAFDDDPLQIEKRMSRRDGFDGDWVEINIDSYYDKRTAFSFTACVSGVKGDEYVTDDGNNWDSNWDPIWYLKTSSDDKGWIAEMKIPFDQLRFSSKFEQIWGIQFTRRIFRKDERSVWSYFPSESPGWVQHFGELLGINGIKPKLQKNITPYVVTQFETFKKEEGNPFATGNSMGINAGLDGKIGISNDFTLDFTINPDFGQVEADPSELNLTAFETYFQEKRPFFIESNNITSFRPTSGDGPLSSDNLFYSRRIGRSPQYYPDLQDNEYVDRPERTSILGAFKLTGKTQNGWSVGLIESVTSKEYAKQAEASGNKKNIEVEPLTNYFIGRLQKDINKGNTIIGGIITSTNRKIDNDYLNFLHKNAYTGGLDFMQYFKDKKYYVSLRTVFSSVSGDSTALLQTQQSSIRYFQRPDAKNFHIDSSGTSLQGNGGSLEFGRRGSGKFRFLNWITWRSPGLELNDLGYLRRGDEIQQVFWCNYKITQPIVFFRSFNINANQWSGFDFEGKSLYKGGNVGFNSDLKNYWYINFGYSHEFKGISNAFLRGGPYMTITAINEFYASISTDRRKKVQLSADSYYSLGDENSYSIKNYGIGLTVRPINPLSVYIYPSLNIEDNKLQYITTSQFNNNSRYIFGTIDRKTISLMTRINYSITPDLSVQYYGEAFISAGEYKDFKHITDPRSSKFEDHFRIFNANEIQFNKDDNLFEIDENQDNTIDYDFTGPDFNFKQFRSNLVLRWEYLPGSVLFLVWSQGRSEYLENDGFSYGKDMNALFSQKPHNIFLLKFSYRLKM